MGDRMSTLPEVILRVSDLCGKHTCSTWLFDKLFGHKDIVTWFDIEVTKRE